MRRLRSIRRTSVSFLQLPFIELGITLAEKRVTWIKRGIVVYIVSPKRTKRRTKTISFIVSRQWLKVLVVVWLYSPYKTKGCNWLTMISLVIQVEKMEEPLKIYVLKFDYEGKQMFHNIRSPTVTKGVYKIWRGCQWYQIRSGKWSGVHWEDSRKYFALLP